ncbi:MAG: DUF547 domain-containing protein [Planctomycetota bacterium]|jgi:hypothetical protein
MAFIGKKAEIEKVEAVKYRLPRLPNFRFTLLASITSIIVSISIIGCTSTKPGPNEPVPTVPEPNTVEITRPEPNEAGIPEPEPEPEPEPNNVRIPEIEPNTVDANQIKPDPNVSFHDKCAPILKAFVDNKGMVDYNKLRRKKSELSTLLDEFAKLDPNEYKSWPKEDKIAFWLNAYNLQTLRIIVARYPIKSYRMLHVIPGWGPHSIQHISKRHGAIRKRKFKIMGEEFTLRQVEQRFFYKEFDEPRVFFALCDATLSSPPLCNEPYRGHKLDKQLNEQAKRFLSNPRVFRIDRGKRRVYLSSTLQATWHGRQFINKYRTDKRFKEQSETTRAVLNCLANYISKEDLFFLERKNYSVKFIRYDWKINDTLTNK